MIDASKKRDWNEIVSKSDGNLLFLPDGFKQAAQEWLDLRTEYNNLVKKMAEKELTLNAALNGLFLEVRRYLAKNGHEDVWIKDVGFESEALKDGKFIVNIMDAGRQMPRM